VFLSLETLEMLETIETLEMPGVQRLSAKLALIRFRNSIADMRLKLLKRALETLEKSCYLLKHS